MYVIVRDALCASRFLYLSAFRDLTYGQALLNQKQLSDPAADRGHHLQSLYKINAYCPERAEKGKNENSINNRRK